MLGAGRLSLGLVTTWADDVLRFDGDGNSYRVDHLLSPTLLAAVGVRPWGLPLELGVAVPFGVMAGDRGPDSDGGTPASPNDDEDYRFSGQGLGDLVLRAKLRLHPASAPPRLGAALIVAAQLPTTTAAASWIGGGAAAEARLIVDTERGRWRLAANLGARLAATTTFRDDRALGHDGQPQPTTGGSVGGGSVLPFGVAAAWALSPERFELIGEVYGAAPRDGAWFPAEAVAGVRIYLERSSFLSLGVGAGLSPGAAANTDARAFLGIVFEPGNGDRDGDSRRDDADRCPSEAEDLDGFADADGCPDLDDDRDGVVDAVDHCRRSPEDRDGVEDGDGCAESGTSDRDGDGIVDGVDACPDDPEDLDDFEDADGCPDPDNDRDRILDLDDLCPDEPEDVDDFEDADGCPEEGPIVFGPTGTGVAFDNVYFEFDSAVIQERSHAILRAIALAIEQNPGLALLEIQGHTDERGAAAYNLALSQERAEAVRAFLIGQHIAGERLEARGYGESAPLVGGHDQAAWARNRRVELVILRRAAD